MAMTPDDLSPEYRAVFESFRRLGLSEREAMAAATCRPLDRHGHGPGASPATLAERGAMFAEAGTAAVEAFDAIGASVLGREFGSEEHARRELAESWHPSGGVGAVDAGRLVDERVTGLDEGGRRHVVGLVETLVGRGWPAERALATAVESERSVQARASSPRQVELREARL